ncbi:hypothetical protein [Thermococcus sp.]|uniref:hypothetical protein n=1 Tax=Thermococcus sp. TaxID=35749 RepID=UPI00260A421C|nr:hypothetical protein [Thermococcus sp.]
MPEPLVEFAEALGYEIDEDMIGEIFSVVTLEDGQEVEIVGLDGVIYAKGPGKLYVAFIPEEGYE